MRRGVLTALAPLWKPEFVVAAAARRLSRRAHSTGTKDAARAVARDAAAKMRARLDALHAG
jgi:hypothetical protein